MSTHEIFIFEPSTVEESRALKAFAEALKLKFRVSKSQSEVQEILNDLEEAFAELNLIKEDKVIARDAKELLNEL